MYATIKPRGADSIHLCVDFSRSLHHEESCGQHLIHIICTFHMKESSSTGHQDQIPAKDHFMDRSPCDCKELLLKKIMKIILQLEGHHVD